MSIAIAGPQSLSSADPPAVDQAAIWTMSGTTQLGASLVGGNPGTSWHIPTGVG
ncbi:MAG TPA: hypothetical protein VGB91_15690 [Rhizomicrobium sp.]